MADENPKHDYKIGFCPLIKDTCRQDCMMWHERQGNQQVYSECKFKRAIEKIVESTYRND